MERFSRYIMFAFGVLLVAAVLGMSWGLAFVGSQKSISESALVNNTNATKALSVFDELNRLIGYYGMIHHFKNYVIRQTDLDLGRVSQSYNDIRAKTGELESLLETPEERLIFSKLVSVIDLYYRNILVARRLVEEDRGIAFIDDATRISDQPAVEAQRALRVLLEERKRNAELAAERNLDVFESLTRLGPILLTLILFLVGSFILLFSRLRKDYASLQNAKIGVDLLFETTPDSVLAVNEKGFITRANKTAIDYFGFHDSLVGRSVKELVPNSVSEGHLKILFDYFKQPSSQKMTSDLLSSALLANGETREVSLKLASILFMAAPLTIISIRDVTEENRSKAQLLETQARVVFAANVARFGVWEWDRFNDQLSLDYWARALHGTPEETIEVLYSEWLAMIHSDDSSEIDARFKSGLADEEDIELNYRVILGNGDVHYLRLSAGTQRDESNSVIKVIGIVQDVTIEREAQFAMEQARSQALAASEVKSLFLANMSHEIRTPLNAVLGMLTILDNSTLSDYQQKQVKSAHSSAKSLLTILNDILDFTKIEAGKVAIVKELFDLDKMASKSIDLFSAVADSKGISLVSSIGSDVHLSVVGDSLRLNQIFSNLLSNSIKFTQQGGVSLEIASLASGPNDCRLRFAVKDSGIGMTEAQIKRALAPFGQADMSTTRDFGGTGLGLPICNSLLALMGSELKIDSVPGEGTVVFFDLQFGLERRSFSRYRDVSPIEKNVLLVICDRHLRSQVEETIAPWVSGEVYLKEFPAALDTISDVDCNLEFLITDLSNSKFGGELRTLCNQWIKSRTRQRDNMVILSLGRSDPLDGLDIPLFKPNILTTAATPSKLYEALNIDQAQWSVQIPVNDSVEDAIRVASSIKGAHILIVEDVATNQVIAQEFLTMLGLRSTVIDSGAEAIKKVDSEHFDGVLMDLNMPGFNGLEATQRIRSNLANAKLPIIAMTASAFDHDIALTLESGMNAHLSKPIEINKLAQILVQYISMSTLEKKVGKSPGVEAVQRFPGLTKLPKAVDPVVVEVNFNNNRRLFMKCLRAFSVDFSDWVVSIKSAEYQADDQEIKSLLHKLKGTAANIGAVQLANRVSVLGSRIDDGWSNSLDRIIVELTELLSEIEEIAMEDVRDDPITPENSKVSQQQDCLAAMDDLRRDLQRQRYVPPGKLDDFTATLPDAISPTLVAELRKNIERLDYAEASRCLDAIVLALP